MARHVNILWGDGLLTPIEEVLPPKKGSGWKGFSMEPLVLKKKNLEESLFQKEKGKNPFWTIISKSVWLNICCLFRSVFFVCGLTVDDQFECVLSNIFNVDSFVTWHDINLYRG